MRPQVHRQGRELIRAFLTPSPRRRRGPFLFFLPFYLPSRFRRPSLFLSPLLSCLHLSALLFSSPLVENVAENVERETNCPDILDSISRPLASHLKVSLAFVSFSIGDGIFKET